jgi:hypothetical protein
MSLTFDQIQRIRDHLPGWQKAWGQLCVLLLGNDGENGALVRAVKALPIKWPTPYSATGSRDASSRESSERDDFIGTVMLDYHERAYRGTLLSSYDPSLGDVVAFLTSRHTLYVEAVKFLSSLPYRRPEGRGKQEFLEDAVGPDDVILAAKPTDDESTSEFARLIDRLQEELPAKIEQSKRITRIIEQAAIQWYPRLEWARPSLQRLRQYLIDVLRRPPDGGDGLSALQDAHRAADRDFQRRLDRIAARIDNHGRGVSIRKRERLEKRFAKLCFERLLLPIGAVVLAELLGISQSDAAQRRSRYWRGLADLLPEIRADYEALRRQS